MPDSCEYGYQDSKRLFSICDHEQTEIIIERVNLCLFLIQGTNVEILPKLLRESRIVLICGKFFRFKVKLEKQEQILSLSFTQTHIHTHLLFSICLRRKTLSTPSPGLAGRLSTCRRQGKEVRGRGREWWGYFLPDPSFLQWPISGTSFILTSTIPRFQFSTGFSPTCGHDSLSLWAPILLTTSPA